MLEVLGVLLVLAFPVAVIVALVFSIGARDRLRQLEIRLMTVEARFALQGPETVFTPSPGPTPQAPPPPMAEPIVPPAAAEPPPVSPVMHPAEPAPPIEPVAPPPSPPVVPEGPGFEERFGTRWVVWVGGLALALGGIFLVRYSIEQGLLGPAARVFLGGLFAAALIVAGEWARRTERLSGLANLPTAHIPGILTAAGTTVAYATVFAAYELYHFLSPAIAFVLLGVVALATLAAALLHGPALAGLGLVGAYVAPLLVSTSTPNYWALYLYLAVVTGAAFALARMRMWRWLAITAIVFATFWMVVRINDLSVDSLGPHAFHAVASFVLVAVLIVAGFLYGPDAEPGRIDAVSSIGPAVFLACAALLVIVRHHDSVALAAFTILLVATVLIAWRAESATAAVPAAAVLAAAVISHWAVEFEIDQLIAPGGATAGLVPEPQSAAVGLHLALGAGYAALLGGASFLVQGRSERPIGPILWAAAGVFAPIAILIALYYRIAGFERSIPFAGIALVLAALYGYATEQLAKRPPHPGMATAAAIYAIGAIAALALTLTFSLEKGWLTVALALMVPGIAYVAEKRPLPMLRWLAAIVGLGVLARIGWEPRIVGADVGTTPILNWLLYGYGVPALSFWVAGHLLRKRADDIPSRMVDSLAILFTVLLAFLEIRHFVNNGDVYRDASGLTEVALQVSVGLAMTIGLERVRRRTNNIVHDIGALVVAALTLAAIVFGLGVIENPLGTGEPVGGPFINLVLLGYGLPAVLAAALALITRGTRPPYYRWIAAVVAVALALAYLTIEVRTLFQGPVLDRAAPSNAELYTYSAVWLVFGVLLLIVGILLRSQPARLASAAVVMVTIAKVFVFDLAGIEGVFRALSFIGLGLVLVSIGRLYQLLLFPRRAPSAPPFDTPPSPA